VRDRDVKILHQVVDSKGAFGHRQHLELAWSYLREYPPDEAAEAMAAAIRHVARSHGAADRYHETITRTWVHLVAVHRHRWGAETFEEFLERNGDLLDTGLLTHFYSRELILGDHARAVWAAPDLRPLPALS
jgi:hypothetical protein